MEFKNLPCSQSVVASGNHDRIAHAIRSILERARERSFTHFDSVDVAQPARIYATKPFKGAKKMPKALSADELASELLIELGRGDWSNHELRKHANEIFGCEIHETTLANVGLVIIAYGTMVPRGH